MAGGEGTKNNPYLIENITDMLMMDDSNGGTNGYYKIVNDLVIDGDWQGINHTLNYGSLYLDGDNHTITFTDIHSQGLFNEISNVGQSRIENIVFNNVNIICNYPSETEHGIGAVVGKWLANTSQYMTNVRVNGKIIGASYKDNEHGIYIGGLIGLTTAPISISNCYSIVDINIDTDINITYKKRTEQGEELTVADIQASNNLMGCAGGFVGEHRDTNAKIFSVTQNSVYYGTIEGNAYFIGGIAGLINGGSGNTGFSTVAIYATINITDIPSHETGDVKSGSTTITYENKCGYAFGVGGRYTRSNISNAPVNGFDNCYVIGSIKTIGVGSTGIRGTICGLAGTLNKGTTNRYTPSESTRATYMCADFDVNELSNFDFYIDTPVSIQTDYRALYNVDRIIPEFFELSTNTSFAACDDSAMKSYEVFRQAVSTTSYESYWAIYPDVEDPTFNDGYAILKYIDYYFLKVNADIYIYVQGSKGIIKIPAYKNLEGCAIRFNGNAGLYGIKVISISSDKALPIRISTGTGIKALSR